MKDNLSHFDVDVHSVWTKKTVYSLVPSREEEGLELVYFEHFVGLGGSSRSCDNNYWYGNALEVAQASIV